MGIYTLGRLLKNGEIVTGRLPKNGEIVTGRLPKGGKIVMGRLPKNGEIVTGRLPKDGENHGEIAEGWGNSHWETDTGRRKSLEDCVPERGGSHGETRRSKKYHGGDFRK